MKILITGGHLAPALALIDEIQKIKKIKIVFVGRKYSFDGEKKLSLEYLEIKKRNIKFIEIKTGRLTRIFSLQTLINFFKFFLGLINGFIILTKEKPDKIISFGGYLAIPIVFWGYIFRIPIFTHEQTIKPGLANRLIGFFAQKIFVAFSQAKEYFPLKKVILSGNPLKKAIFEVKKKPFLINKDKPVIYITGGSVGSHSINLHIKKILISLLKKYIVIHQTGNSEKYNDFFELTLLKKTLPFSLSKNYFIKDFFLEDEIGYIYSLADLVVGRSGANTFFELIALKKPAVFIPLPWSAGREQQYHAEIFVKNGLGEIFHQIEPSEKLLRLIDKMITNLSFYQKNFSLLKDQNQKNAVKIILANILGKN